MKLTPREYDLLRLLIAHAGKVLTHKFILKEVWGGETDVQYLRIYIRTLRQKLEADPEQPRLIRPNRAWATGCAPPTLSCAENPVAKSADFPIQKARRSMGSRPIQRGKIHIMSKRILSACALGAGIAALLAAGASAAPRGTDWPNYGNDRGAMRYSPLTQITPANVTSLKVAWTYHMKPADATRVATSETTPLVVGNIMYLGSPYGHIVALDATTGKEIWNYKLPGNHAARAARHRLLARRQGLCARTSVRHQ